MPCCSEHQCHTFGKEVDMSKFACVQESVKDRTGAEAVSSMEELALYKRALRLACFENESIEQEYLEMAAAQEGGSK